MVFLGATAVRGYSKVANVLKRGYGAVTGFAATRNFLRQTARNEREIVSTRASPGESGPVKVAESVETSAGQGLAGTGQVAKGGVDVGRQIWSSTKSKTSVENAFKHWNDHKNEFPELFNAKQYVERSRSLFQHSEKTLTKTRDNGEILHYEPRSNTFGAFTKDGVPKTMFRPRDGIYYWETRN